MPRFDGRLAAGKLAPMLLSFAYLAVVALLKLFGQ